MTESAGRGDQRAFASAKVRFYFDADVLGLAKLVAQARNDVTAESSERRNTFG